MTTAGRTRVAPERLTRRQQEVLELLRRGFTNEEIAQRLGISLDGAKWHVSEIIGSLGVADRYEAARWRPEGERRPWWMFAWLREGHWSVAAKAVSAATLAVATVAIIALGWGVWRTNDDAAVIVPGARTLVLGTDSGVVIAVDTETGGVALRFSALKDTAHTVAPDGTMAAFPCGDDALPYHDPTDRALCIRDDAGSSVVVSSSDLPPDRFITPYSEIAWSDDASKIAFLAYEEPAQDVSSSGDLYVKDLQSGELRLLDHGELARWRGLLQWSPDATHISMLDIAMSSAVPDEYQVTVGENLRLIDVASGQRSEVFSSLITEGAVERYAWSPDSRAIAFTRGEEEQGLYVVDVTATAMNPRRIGDAWVWGEPAWSPDGAWIAASEGNEHDTHVFVTRADGSERRIVDGGMTSSSDPAWSPDSRRVAFAGKPTDSSRTLLDLHIYVVDTSGAAPREIADASPLDDVIIAWSGDGERVLYTADAGACDRGICPPGHLLMVSADGSSAPRMLYEQPVNEILGSTQ
jgi:Tol biopolymer transport system component/DNA-binding CsgD family transcriptional regulator